jgi:integrase
VDRYSFKRILRRAPLPDIKFQALLHTCATALLLADEHPKVVEERLGHATMKQFLNTYSHCLPGLQNRAAEKMDYLSGGPRQAPKG